MVTPEEEARLRLSGTITSEELEGFVPEEAAGLPELVAQEEDARGPEVLGVGGGQPRRRGGQEVVLAKKEEAAAF